MSLILLYQFSNASFSHACDLYVQGLPKIFMYIQSSNLGMKLCILTIERFISDEISKLTISKFNFTAIENVSVYDFVLLISHS